MTAREPRWLLCRRRRPAAALRLYCFPHSGGSPGEYVRWADGLPDSIEVWAVQLPGRGSRGAEQPITDLNNIVEAFVSEARLTAPYAFFGHSLGAGIAYHAARLLRDRSLPEPTRLIASSYAAPHLHRSPISLETANGPDLVNAVARLFGAIPNELRRDPKALELHLRPLRADMIVAATHRYAEDGPLTCPITVLSGQDDGETEDRLAAWTDHTVAACTFRSFPGGHFYFRDRLPEFLADLSATLLRDRTG
ncbi:thioesterase [Micromonospora sp. STR1_7]|uniref:Thioesterase n=1 Tax=Micromonospora parastrephiae TaxID=2806101 RepID=A0ABS1XN99_9ACTN|nr:alpha/beta fold hydrolase [Micromonospora parastrephiae]MBM0230719.1 thioesterase [Micromonospora parastrephiae]